MGVRAARLLPKFQPPPHPNGSVNIGVISHPPPHSPLFANDANPAWELSGVSHYSALCDLERGHLSTMLSHSRH